MLIRGPHRPDSLFSSLSFAHPIPPSGSLFFPTSPHTTRRLVHGWALPEEPDKGLRHDSYLVLPSQRPPKESHLLPLIPLGQINSLVISQSVCPLLTASGEQHIPHPPPKGLYPYYAIDVALLKTFSREPPSTVDPTWLPARSPLSPCEVGKVLWCLLINALCPRVLATLPPSSSHSSCGSRAPGEYCVKGVIGKSSVHPWLDSEGEPWQEDRSTQEGQE